MRCTQASISTLLDQPFQPLPKSITKPCVATRYYVDFRPAAIAAAGELLKAIEAGVVGENHIVGEIGAVAAGEVPARQSADEITCYKSLGVVAQDLSAALAVWRAATEQGVGMEVDLLA